MRSSLLLATLLTLPFATACDEAETSSAVPLVVSGVGLSEAGYWFGLCAGRCRGELTFNRNSVRLVVRGWDSSKPDDQDNNGRLTAAGVDALVDAMDGLDPSALKETYGCPDCADGGAFYVKLQSGARLTQHTFEYGESPSGLAPLATDVMSIMEALQTCTSNALITVASPCTP